MGATLFVCCTWLLRLSQLWVVLVPWCPLFPSFARGLDPPDSLFIIHYNNDNDNDTNNKNRTFSVLRAC
jgi:hypothetical protein